MVDLLAAVRLLVSRGSSNDTEMYMRDTLTYTVASRVFRHHTAIH